VLLHAGTVLMVLQEHVLNAVKDFIQRMETALHVEASARHAVQVDCALTVIQDTH